MAVLVTIEAAVIVLLAVLVAGLLRSHAEILRALHDLGAGTERDPHSPVRRRATGEAAVADLAPASDVVGARPGGGASKVGVVGTEHDTLLAFLSSGCAACAEFWRTFDGDALDLPGEDTRLVVVTKSPSEESEAHVVGLAPEKVPVVMSTAAWEDYGVPVTPYFVLVDGPAGRVVGEGAANGWEQVHSLLTRAVADAGLARARAPRTPRPARFREREALADEELLAAGIAPGNPSLYPESPPEEG